MEVLTSLFITIMIILLSVKLYKYRTKIGKHNETVADLNAQIRELVRQNTLSDNELTDTSEDLRIANDENQALERYLKLFINEKLKVYVNSNFHSNWNMYNGRFYAKVNKRTTNNTAEAIPVLPIKESKYHVIDVYTLRSLQRLNPDESILDHLEASKVLKENMIQELGNKILTSYFR